MTNPWFLLCAGLLPGSLLAFGLHLIFVKMRRSALNATNILGWILLTLMAALGGLWLYVGIPMMSDPLASMGGAWTALGIALLVLVGIALFLGGVHAILGRVSYRKIAGAVGLEVVAALTLGYLLQSSLVYPLADILRGGNRETSAILASYGHSRTVLSGVFLSLATVLLILLLFRIGDSSTHSKE